MKRTNKIHRHLAISAMVALNLASTKALANGHMPPYENFVAAKQYVQSVSNRVQTLIYRSQGGSGGEGGGHGGGHGRPGGWGEGQPGNNNGGGGSGRPGGWGEGQPGNNNGGWGSGRPGGWGEGQPGNNHGGWGNGQPGSNHGPVLRSLPQDVSDAEGALMENDAMIDAVMDNEEGEEILENDHLANLALQVMGQKLFHLGQTIDQATMNYGTPAFWGYWTAACGKTKELLFANQGAKVSASLPIQGLVTPADFEPNDFELNAVKQQLWCP